MTNSFIKFLKVRVAAEIHIFVHNLVLVMRQKLKKITEYLVTSLTEVIELRGLFSTIFNFVFKLRLKITESSENIRAESF